MLIEVDHKLLPVELLGGVSRSTYEEAERAVTVGVDHV